MLKEITDPTILAQYPHLAPPKLRVVDMVATGDGRGGTVYAIDPGTPEPGRLVQCTDCGTYLRAGQPHTATLPFPHQSLDMLTVEEPETDTHYTGNLSHDLDRESQKVELPG